MSKQIKLAPIPTAVKSEVSERELRVRCGGVGGPTYRAL
jgi:hypothetical protein